MSRQTVKTPGAWSPRDPATACIASPLARGPLFAMQRVFSRIGVMPICSSPRGRTDRPGKWWRTRAGSPKRQRGCGKIPKGRGKRWISIAGRRSYKGLRWTAFSGTRIGNGRSVRRSRHCIAYAFWHWAELERFTHQPFPATAKERQQWGLRVTEMVDYLPDDLPY